MIPPSEQSRPRGALHNMSVPPRTSFESNVRPVSGKLIIFWLPPPKPPLTKCNLARPIFECGLENIPPLEQVEQALDRMPAFLIGLGHQATGNAKTVRSTDAARIIAILSRRVGDLYVRSRQPDYSAAHLLGQPHFLVESWDDTQ